MDCDTVCDVLVLRAEVAVVDEIETVDLRSKIIAISDFGFHVLGAEFERVVE